MPPTRYLQRTAGWYLGYAYLPEQVPEGGIVQIQLLEGRLDRIDLQWPDSLPVQRRVIEGYLAQLRPGDILRVRDVERVVFLINDLRGITARFDIVAGAQPGWKRWATPSPPACWRPPPAGWASGC